MWKWIFLFLLIVPAGYTNAQLCNKKKAKQLEIQKEEKRKLQYIAKKQNKPFDYVKRYGLKETYIPTPGSQEDFDKTIHVSVHIWQRADGTGGIPDDEETIRRFKKVEIWMNNLYRKNHGPIIDLPYETQFVEEPRLFIEIDSVYFYQDTTKDSSLFYCNRDYMHNIKLDNYLKENHPERLRSLRLHIVRGEYPGAWGYSHDGSVLTFVTAKTTDMGLTSKADYDLSKHWVHEIAHGLDLWHTYNAQSAWQQNAKLSYVDFLWDVYDTTATKPCKDNRGFDVCLIPIEKNNNNIMGGGEAWWKSALQLGIMRRSTVLENVYNRRYSVRDYVTGYSFTPIKVTEDETWDFSMKMYQNVVIEKGATLTITSEIQFVPYTKIIVKPGARLVLDGGVLKNENYYQSTWDGLELRGKNKKNKKKRGVLEILNGGKIENVRE